MYEDEEDEEDEKQDFFLVFVSRGSEGPLPHRLCLGYQKNEYLVAVPRSHLTLKIQKSVVIINILRHCLQGPLDQLQRHLYHQYIGIMWLGKILRHAGPKITTMQIHE